MYFSLGENNKINLWTFSTLTKKRKSYFRNHILILWSISLLKKICSSFPIFLSRNIFPFFCWDNFLSFFNIQYSSLSGTMKIKNVDFGLKISIFFRSVTYYRIFKFIFINFDIVSRIVGYHKEFVRTKFKQINEIVGTICIFLMYK